MTVDKIKYSPNGEVNHGKVRRTINKAIDALNLNDALTAEIKDSIKIGYGSKAELDLHQPSGREYAIADGVPYTYESGEWVKMVSMNDISAFITRQNMLDYTLPYKVVTNTEMDALSTYDGRTVFNSDIGDYRVYFKGWRSIAGGDRYRFNNLHTDRFPLITDSDGVGFAGKEWANCISDTATPSLSTLEVTQTRLVMDLRTLTAVGVIKLDNFINTNGSSPAKGIKEIKIYGVKTDSVPDSALNSIVTDGILLFDGEIPKATMLGDSVEIKIEAGDYRYFVLDIESNHGGSSVGLSALSLYRP